MKRISDIEKKYVMEALDNEFASSKNNVFNQRMEIAFSKKIGASFSIGHVNGTATMHTALNALNVGTGDEVIVPPLTMSSTSLAVLQNGSLPVFADINLDTFNIDVNSIEKNISNKTKGVITVSLYGLTPDYDKINRLCKERNLFLLEDNAQCLLGKYKNKFAGNFGDFSSFSFQASKHITCGEGGILTTDNEDLADRARRFSSLGYAGIGANKGKITKEDIQDPSYDRHLCIGFNYRLSEVNAAVILGQIERADELVAQRVAVAKIYDDAISDSNIFIKQKIPQECSNSYWSYALILNTNSPEIDWYKFKKIHNANGGEGYYAARNARVYC
ncbi:MAG: DegT/DnrJ/EryC1/StrS family aminotransferase [Oligoflexia bacterium]|nr:DegT/DnrJ/EryC1/StrS family aminotransferase [Oligoflexia bacterium]